MTITVFCEAGVLKVWQSDVWFSWVTIPMDGIYTSMKARWVRRVKEQLEVLELSWVKSDLERSPGKVMMKVLTVWRKSLGVKYNISEELIFADSVWGAYRINQVNMSCEEDISKLGRHPAWGFISKYILIKTSESGISQHKHEREMMMDQV